MKGEVTSFFTYFWLSLGLLTLVKPDVVLSAVFDSKATRDTRLLIELVGVLLMCLSLMTCPNPHGYFMASAVISMGALKFYAVDGVVLGKTMPLCLALVVLPVALSSLAVFSPHDEEAPRRKK